MSKLVRNGREKHPGANFVIPVSTGGETSKLPIDLRFRKEKIELKYGDVVERHMKNGDIVLLNRQPTLHKQSMMGHRSRIIDNPDYCTFRLNPNVVAPYNADFDGDEMNIFACQSIQAQIELEQIADVKYQIMTPQSSAPIISIKEDALVGSFNMTGNELSLDWRSAMNMLSATKLNSYNVIPKEKTISGKEVYSTIIPKKINMYKGDGVKAVISVKNGEIVEGRIGDVAIAGKKKNNLIQLVLDEYGVDEAVVFLDNITRLVNNFNLYHGMTVGIGDLDISYDLYKKMYQVFKTKKLEVKHEITEIENNPDMMNEELFEVTIKQKLDVIRDDIGKLIFNNLKPNNNMKIMNECGSKGSILNIGQMGGCVGNQDFQGDRMPKNYNGRTLPYFFKNDDSAEARGFIEGSFLNGLNLSEFIFHHVTGREGLIDQALKSVTPDTTIMIMENSKTKIVKIGEWIDEHLITGYKNTPELIETQNKMNFELLNVKNMYIPTVDEDGQITWGEVTALTRHDSGNCIYEIVTQSGRKVKVPESKSLLVWKDNKFVPLLTPEVKVGDNVPVTMKLSVPPELINEIDMSEYFSKKEYIYGSEFVKGKLEMENAMNGQERIPVDWWEQNNGVKFTLPYDKKADFQRVLSESTDVSNIKDNYFYCYSSDRDSLIPDKFKLNRENGQFLGLYIANGDVSIGGSGYIQITKNNEAVLNFVEKYFDKFQINHARQNNTTAVGTSMDVRGFSTILAKFMEMISGNDSTNKKIPDFAFNAPEEFIIGLIDGYFSGDGTVGNNHIDASSGSEKLIDGINMLLSRLGIFAKKAVIKEVNANNDFRENSDSYTISIRGQWAKEFKTKIGTLINSDKNIDLTSMKPSENDKYYQEIKDVVLDTIVSINKLDSKDYPKLYDLTVPSTLNFILANGLGVRDTASSGYLQRKFIKATEDFMVKYDGTVRNAVERIQQFIYGDSGIDTVKQYDYKFKMMEMNNMEMVDKFKFTKEELKGLKNFSESNNEAFFKEILSMRDHLRETQLKATMNYLVLNTNYMLPVNINRIVDNAKNSENKDPVLNEPEYIIKLIENILLPDKCRLYSMTEEEMKNEKSPKFIDDKLSKSAFRYALYETLAPKKCIYVYKFSKKQLDNISQQIISSFNRSVVEPGEMVGILGAQSLGEPVTQMVLNSVDWKEEILVRDDTLKKEYTVAIGKLIDEMIEKEKDKVVEIGDNLENNMEGIYYLDTKNKNYHIQSVNEDGIISWKKIEAFTKHLPINKDGSNTLIKVTTRTDKTVIATKGKSFLTQKDNKIVPIRGDEIKVGDYLPIMKNHDNYHKDEELVNNGYYNIYPSVKLESDKNTSFTRDKLVKLLNTNLSENDKEIINKIVNNDVFFDEIISIEEVKPSNKYVYDFTVEETQNFIMANGLCMRDSFHNTGIGGLGGANLGVPRMQEVFSLSKNMKAPFMMVYLDKEYRNKKDFANKIASYIKFTTIRDLRTKIEIYYDPKPYDKGGFMDKDNVYNVFYAFQQSKSCCLNKVDGLPWLMRIEFDKEKLMNKEVSLLDIKSKFCVEWEKRFQDVKSMKREKRQILEKITQLAVLTNTDNDSTPTMHIRFDMTNFNSSTLIDFMDTFVDEFKLKGMPDIEEIAGGNATEERLIYFDTVDGTLEKNKTEFVIYTKGINMVAIRDIIGVDLTRTYCNDIITTYEMFGIEAARNLIIREITAVFAANSSAVNHQHVSIFGDLMTNVGSLTSIDRHGINKLDTDPLARASFEKTVEQLVTAAVFNEVDHMNSVSSRIMAGLCIKGGTGLCNLVLDRDLLENSEYTIDIGQLYKKTYDDIVPTLVKQEIDTDVFIPEF